MTKKLNTDQIVNDLEGSAFFRRHVGQTPDRPTPQPLSPSTATAQPPHDPPTSPSIDQSTHQSIDQSTKETTNAIVDRPKAFYITQRLDRTLDEAVRYYQDVHGIKKADRSIIINAILDTKSQWTNESLDVLVDRVISQLTSRLTGR